VGSSMLAFDVPFLLRWPPDLTTALATIAILALTVRPAANEHRLLADITRQQLFRHLANGAVRMLLPFVATLALVVSLLPVGSAESSSLSAWLCLWAFGAVTGVIEVRLLLAALVMHWREQGRLKEAVAIYGTGNVAERLLETMQRDGDEAVEL